MSTGSISCVCRSAVLLPLRLTAEVRHGCVFSSMESSDGAVSGSARTASRRSATAGGAPPSSARSVRRRWLRRLWSVGRADERGQQGGQGPLRSAAARSATSTQSRSTARASPVCVRVAEGGPPERGEAPGGCPPSCRCRRTSRPAASAVRRRPGSAGAHEARRAASARTGAVVGGAARTSSESDLARRARGEEQQGDGLDAVRRPPPSLSSSPLGAGAERAQRGQGRGPGDRGRAARSARIAVQRRARAVSRAPLGEHAAG